MGQRRAREQRQRIRAGSHEGTPRQRLRAISTSNNAHREAAVRSNAARERWAPMRSALLGDEPGYARKIAPAGDLLAARRLAAAEAKRARKNAKRCDLWLRQTYLPACIGDEPRGVIVRSEVR